MNRWKSFWSNVGAVAYKEAAVIRHDKAFLSMVFIQPWIMFTLFGFVLSNRPANVPLGVLEQMSDIAPSKWKIALSRGTMDN